jgi:hypothetical protein
MPQRVQKRAHVGIWKWTQKRLREKRVRVLLGFRIFVSALRLRGCDIIRYALGWIGMLTCAPTFVHCSSQSVREQDKIDQKFGQRLSAADRARAQRQATDVMQELNAFAQRLTAFEAKGTVAHVGGPTE